MLDRILMEALVENTYMEFENMSGKKETRIVLIGCTGVGKSSLGNSLLGDECFEESAEANSVTMECARGQRTVGTRNIKVVDTPGVISSDGTHMFSVLGDFFNFLSPGPHAIIIVISPSRDSALARKALADLRQYFGDDHFLDFTMLIIVKKHEIFRKGIKDVKEFIEKKSSDDVKQLYARCMERAVAVENLQDMSERKKDAEEVFKIIDSMDGYYDHAYFKKVSIENKKITELQEKIRQLELEKNQKKRFYFFKTKP